MTTAGRHETLRVRTAILNELRQEPMAAMARRRCAEHIDSPHPALARLEVRRLILACHYVGRWHLRKILNAAKVDGTRHVGELTDRERQALHDVLLEPWPNERRPEPVT